MDDIVPSPAETHESNSDLGSSISPKDLSISEVSISSPTDEGIGNCHISDDSANGVMLPHGPVDLVTEELLKLSSDNSVGLHTVGIAAAPVPNLEHEPLVPKRSSELNGSNGDVFVEASETLDIPAVQLQEKPERESGSDNPNDICHGISAGSNVQNGNLSTKADIPVKASGDDTIKSSSSVIGVKANNSAIEHQKKHLESAAKPVNPYRGLVDTAAPFESVREAVSKFGGIVDWKAHKAQMLERRKLVRLELEKVRKEIPQLKERTEIAETVKAQVIEELMETKRLVEELKNDLERAQTEEAQARQDSELAQLRVEEIERGINDDASIAAKAQLEVARTRHEKAVAELKSAKEELRLLQEQHATLLQERNSAVSRAEESASAAREVEKKVEELMLELIASKESLELAHSAHHDAEERRIGAALAKEQDCLTWEKELKQVLDELQRLSQQASSTKELKSKLEAATATLTTLSAELAAYMEVKLSEAAQSDGSGEHNRDDSQAVGQSMQETLASKKKELEEVKARLETAKYEAICFRVAATSLEAELESERAALATLQQREGMAAIAVSSLESELDQTKRELEMVRVNEKTNREKMAELPNLLQQAAQEAEEAKLAAQLAQEDLRLAKEDYELVQGSLTTLEIRIRAVSKEIEATEASESLALAAIKALEESEGARSTGEDSPTRVTLSMSEYYMLSERAHEAEELARELVTAALAQVEVAKESESKCTARLHQAEDELEQKATALEAALDRADEANDGKLAAEQGLRKWRAENEQRRRLKGDASPLAAPRRSTDNFADRETIALPEQKMYAVRRSIDKDDRAAARKLKKRSFIPRMLMLLSRKNNRK